MRRTQAQNRSQLRAQDFGVREQQLESPATEGRIRFARQRKVGERLVAAHVQNANHGFPGSQAFRRGPVKVVLLSLRREMILSKENKLGAIQSRAIGFNA